MATDSEKIIMNLIRESTEEHVTRIVENAYIQAGNGDKKILDLLERVAKMEVPVSNYMMCLRLKLAEHKQVV
jgi:hypothetical protein